MRNFTSFFIFFIVILSIYTAVLKSQSLRKASSIFSSLKIFFFRLRAKEECAAFGIFGLSAPFCHLYLKKRQNTKTLLRGEREKSPLKCQEANPFHSVSLYSLEDLCFLFPLFPSYGTNFLFPLPLITFFSKSQASNSHCIKIFL